MHLVERGEFKTNTKSTQNIKTKSTQNGSKHSGYLDSTAHVLIGTFCHVACHVKEEIK